MHLCRKKPTFLWSQYSAQIVIFYWTQRVLSLFLPFVGVLVFCEQKATLMTIHKMQKIKGYRWFCIVLTAIWFPRWMDDTSFYGRLELIVFFVSHWKCVFAMIERMNLTNNNKTTAVHSYDCWSLHFGVDWIDWLSGFMKSLNSLKDLRLILLLFFSSRFILKIESSV